MNPFKGVSGTKIWKKRQRKQNKNQYKQFQIKRRKDKTRNQRAQGNDIDKRQQLFDTTTSIEKKARASNDINIRRGKPMPTAEKVVAPVLKPT